MTSIDRRVFLGAAASVLAAGKLSAAPSARLRVALIGCGGMGNNHLGLLARRSDLEVAWLCDVDSQRLADSAKKSEAAGQKAPQTTGDLRRVLDDTSVDAVWIATPDHWHTPAALLALAAGKHVYVEKPCSHNVREGELLVAAAERYERVVQVGTQSRSTPAVREAIDLVHGGAIGDVLSCKAWNSQRRGNIGHRQPSAPPAHLDFDTWLGPAPERAYQDNLLHAVWRFWYDFGVGDIGNDGVHEIDIARWGLGVTTQPDRVVGLGAKYYFDDDQQFPDTQHCIYEWTGDGAVGHRRQLVFEQRDWSPYVQEGHENGVAFYGTKGYVIVGKGKGWAHYAERNKLVAERPSSADLPAHHQNFLDSIRDRATPNASAEVGHLSASLAHLGNIACRTGRALNLAPGAKEVVGDADATALLSRQYRAGHWGTPVV